MYERRIKMNERHKKVACQGKTFCIFFYISALVSSGDRVCNVGVIITLSSSYPEKNIKYV